MRNNILLEHPSRMDVSPSGDSTRIVVAISSTDPGACWRSQLNRRDVLIRKIELPAMWCCRRLPKHLLIDGERHVIVICLLFEAWLSLALTKFIGSTIIWRSCWLFQTAQWYGFAGCDCICQWNRITEGDELNHMPVSVCGCPFKVHALSLRRSHFDLYAALSETGNADN